MVMIWRNWLLVAVFLGAACGQMEPLDGNRLGPANDAGAVGVDASVNDAGVTSDAAAPKPDAGVEPDAGVVRPEDDHSDQRVAGSRLRPGEGIAGNLDGQADADWFTFTAGVGDLHRIETRGETDTKCALFDAQGVEIARDDDGGEDFNCRIEESLTGGSEYFVEVRHFSEAGTGAYLLFVEIIDAPEVAPALSAAPISVDAGAAITFTGRDFSPGGRVVVEISSGGLQTQQLEAVCDEQGGVEVIWRTARTARTGSYRVVGTDSETMIATQPIEVTVRPAPEDDHADQRGEATTIVSGRLTPGEIHNADDIDWFTFRAGTSGDWVISTRGSLDTTCVLFLAADEIASDDDGGDGLNCRMTHELTADREYFIKVESYGTRTGSYELVVVPPPVPDDHGGDRYSATVLSDGASASGQIGAAGDVDVFGFTAGLTGIYTLRTVGVADTHCQINDLDQRELASDDNSGLLWNCQIRRRLEAGTTYYVRVRHADAEGTGRYWFFIGRPDGERADDHANVSNGATLVAASSLTAGEIEVGRDRDVFHFFTASTGRWRFETSSDLDTVCRLLDDTGNELASNDDAGEGSNCLIEHDLVRERRYVVEVRLYLSGATGAYRLRLTGP